MTNKLASFEETFCHAGDKWGTPAALRRLRKLFGLRGTLPAAAAEAARAAVAAAAGSSQERRVEPTWNEQLEQSGTEDRGSSGERRGTHFPSRYRKSIVQGGQIRRAVLSTKLQISFASSENSFL